MKPAYDIVCKGACPFVINVNMVAKAYLERGEL